MAARTKAWLTAANAATKGSPASVRFGLLPET